MSTLIHSTFVQLLIRLLNCSLLVILEMGRQWYEDPFGGKYLCKKNTFDDFVDVARYFVNEKWTSPDKLSCEGRSAGGLLIGAVLNQAPELFCCAILGVPFVDVVVTMTDSSIPLTSGEWVEW